ncbi:MAG: aminoacyl-tRNA hydrolase [Candidatus Andersenbacteria bacterium]|nr:aminoacyl-tRNA hydrolase [Candidatus Andersenbacteria bacterium]
MYSMQKVLIAGLGNPGKPGTRHNFGIDAVRLFVERMQERGKLTSDWKTEMAFEGEVAAVTQLGREVVCFFPITFMNDSGRAVAKYVNFFKIPLSHVLIVHDELELPLGEVRLDVGGPARGHNGVRSIEQVLGTGGVARLRLGIGRPADGTAVDQYVLDEFADSEQMMVMQTMASAADQILSFTVNLPQE